MDYGQKFANLKRIYAVNIRISDCIHLYNYYNNIIL